MRAVTAGLCALLLVTACDVRDRSRGVGVLAPTPRQDPPPGPAGQTFTVSGVVSTAANVPVAEARVVVLGQETAFATTATDGSYSISGVRSAPTERMSPLLSASKTGFFTDVEFADRTYTPISRDTRLDFRLIPSLAIPLGTVVQGQSPQGDPVCSHWGYGSTACQRYALTVPSSGILEVTLSGNPFNFDLDIVGPHGTFEAYDATWAPPVIVKIPVQAATYEIRVIGGWQPPREFVLSTALR